MFRATVIGNDVHYHFDPCFFEASHHLVEIFQRTDLWVNISKVSHIV